MKPFTGTPCKIFCLGLSSAHNIFKRGDSKQYHAPSSPSPPKMKSLPFDCAKPIAPRAAGNEGIEISAGLTTADKSVHMLVDRS